jgi:hypothetical protein
VKNSACGLHNLPNRSAVTHVQEQLKLQQQSFQSKPKAVHTVNILPEIVFGINKMLEFYCSKGIKPVMKIIQ